MRDPLAWSARNLGRPTDQASPRFNLGLLTRGARCPPDGQDPIVVATTVLGVKGPQPEIMTMANTVLTGASGATYNFEVYPWGQEFRPVGAVYVVLGRSADPQYVYRAIYIGQTQDLSERFDAHHRIACFRRERALWIGVHQDSDAHSRLTKEKDLIDRYDPPCNRE